MGAELQTTVQQRQGVFFAGGSILEPVRNHGQMEQGERICPQIPDIGDLSGRGRFRENLPNKSQVTKVLLLRRKAQWTEPGRWLQGPQINRANKLFIRRQTVEEAVNNGKQPFRQRGALKALIAAEPLGDQFQLLLEEVEGQ